jgi:ABC-type glycerol-3-phosphate transport system permease component
VMAEAPSEAALFLARFAFALIVVFIVLGVYWYGFSVEVHNRVWKDIFDRPAGPMAFRFILQPTMALIAALHDGIRDARRGRSPYLWTILRDPQKRGERIREGLISTSRIVLLGLVMDMIYQYEVLRTFYPGEAVLMVLLLALIPYFVLRGPIARVARRWVSRPASN